MIMNHQLQKLYTTTKLVYLSAIVIGTVNPEMVPLLEDAGLRFTGVDDKGQRMEIIELPESTHPFFSRPNFTFEFKTRPQSPSPPIFGFHPGRCWIMARHRQRLSTYRSPKPQDSRSSRQRIKSTHGGRGS